MSMTIDEMIAVLQGAKEGKVIECINPNYKNDAWSVLAKPCWNFEDFCYRIKPTPRMVPLEAADVPPGSLFRNVGWGSGNWASCVGAWMHNVGIASLNADWHVIIRSYRLLAEEDWEISRDSGKTWQKCEKPEKE